MSVDAFVTSLSKVDNRTPFEKQLKLHLQDVNALLDASYVYGCVVRSTIIIIFKRTRMKVCFLRKETNIFMAG